MALRLAADEVQSICADAEGPFPFATGPFIALSAQVARWLGTSPAVARIMTDVANGQSQRSSSAAEDVQFGWLLSSHPNASALYWDAALVNDIDDVVNRNRFLWHRRRCWDAALGVTSPPIFNGSTAWNDDLIVLPAAALVHHVKTAAQWTRVRAAVHHWETWTHARTARRDCLFHGMTRQIKPRKRAELVRRGEQARGGTGPQAPAYSRERRFAALHWLNRSFPGHCGVTTTVGDCSMGSSGALTLSIRARQSGW